MWIGHPVYLHDLQAETFSYNWHVTREKLH